MNWRNWFRPAPAKQIRKSFRPGVESLEIRETPSISHTFSSGVLTIRETGSNVAHEAVLLTPASGNSVDVKVGITTATTDVGTFKGVSSVYVSLGNGAGDSIAVKDGAFSFAPNLTITEGGGASDVVSFDGTGATGTSILTGRVIVTQGLGTGDTITFGTGSTAGIALTNTVTLSGGAGVGTGVTIGGGLAASSAILNSSVSVSNTTGITIAAGSDILGNLTVSNSSFGGNASSSITGTVGGNINYNGGSGTDALAINGTIGGSVSYNGGANSNTLSIATTAAAIIGKNVTFSGPGVDTINFGSATNVATVGGNVTLSFGNAANTYNFAGAYVIGGNLSVTGGNTIAGNSLTLSSGTIDGNVTVNFGNSATANSFTISGTNVINGSTVSYTGGTFGDTVTVSTTGGGYALDIYLNGSVAGTDTVNLAAVTTLGSLFIIENNGAAKAWTPPTAGISWNTIFINWP